MHVWSTLRKRLAESSRSQKWRERGARQSASAIVSLLIVLALLVTACGPSATPTPAPTTTPPPTATPLPTATAIPTATQVPAVAFTAEGDALLVKSDFPGAEAAYQKAVAADPTYAPAYIGLTWTYIWQLEREDEALAPAQKAVELAPDSALAYVALSQGYLGQVAIAEAVEAAEKAADLDEEDARIQAALAEAYLYDRQYDAALEAAGKAVTLDPNLANAYKVLGTVYRYMADFGRARSALEQAIALEPEFAPWYVSLGYFWSLLGDQEEAMTHFEKALQLNPDHTAAILDLSEVYTERREYEQAETQIEQALELMPDSPLPYVYRGYLYLNQDKPDEALAQFRKALAKEEDNYPAGTGICDVQLQQDECESAARQAQELMTLQPRFARGRIYMGLAKLCAADVNKALEYFRKAGDLEPYSPEPHAGLGYAYARQGRWEESMSAHVEDLRLRPARAFTHNNLAQLFRVQGETDLARAEFETALRLDPDSLEAHVGLAEILLEMDKDAEGRFHAEQALALDEDDPDALRALAVALYSQGMPEKAVEALETLLEREPEDRTGHLFLGLAQRDLAQYADAKKHLETYLALTPEEDVVGMTGVLVQALGQGYTLTESKAIADAKDFMDLLFETEVDVSVEDVPDEGRTLIVSFAVDPEQEQLDLVFDMTFALGVVAGIAPRIEPAVDNGVEIVAEEDGQPSYTLTMELSAVKDFADGVLSEGGLTSALQFSHSVSGEPLASVEEIEEQVAELRELDAKSEVPYEPLTPEGLEKYLTDSLDAQAREAMRTSDLLLTLLGVIGPEADLEQMLQGLYAEQIAGFYDPVEKQFYIVDDAEQTAMDQMVVAHEYVHALQDQHFGLQDLGSEELDDDERRAFDALIEGDAMLGSLLYADQHIAFFDLVQSITGAGGLESEALEETPAFIRELETFPYLKGMEFVLALYESGSWDAVNEAYANPPLSTEQILHPERYREQDLPQEVALPDVASELGDEWRTLENEVMGELGLRLMLAQHLGPAPAMLAAEGWSGDRYVLLQKGDEGPVVLAMHTYWDDHDEADQFFALYRVYMEHWTGYSEHVKELVGELSSRWWESENGWALLQQDGRYVTVILGPDEDTIEQVAEVLKSGE